MYVVVCCSSTCSGCFCFKQKTAYEMRIRDWSSDVCSSDLDLTLTSDFGGWYDILLGLSYLHDDGYYYLFADGAGFRSIIPGDIPRSFNDILTESVSAFGELRLRPIERLTITAGGRYTYDDRELRGRKNLAGKKRKRVR